MGKSKRIIWDAEAILSLRNSHTYISRDSPLQASLVRQKLLEAVRKLSNFPEIHPPDRFKINNDGNFRAFEKFSYRISYYVTEHEVFILRIRHVKQNPKVY
jgi:plasmid stabilization system protein ParE